MTIRSAAAPAVCLALGLALASPAAAWPFGKPAAKPDAAAATAKADAKSQAAPAAPGAAAAPAAPRKATPQERAEAERLEPLARAAFWARETDVDPKDAEAGLKLSQALRALGRNDEAVAAADRILVVYPDNEDALLELARADIARNQGFFALDSLKRASAVAPKDWRAPSLMGVALAQISRTDEAREAWQAALRLSPNNPAVLTNLAMSYVEKGDAASAEPLLRTAAAQPGATLQTRENLALVLGLQGKTAEAERLIRQDLPPELAERNLAWLKARTADPQTATPITN
jgi:Flp pilus assembly protein TadD